MDTLAGIISRSNALQLATDFFNKTIITKTSSASLEFKWDSNSIIPLPLCSTIPEPTFYVFTQKEGKGFVIVSADDNTRQIIAYSLESSLPDINKLPANFKSWLSKCHSQILESRNKSNYFSPSLSSVWDQINVGNVVVQLQTAKWNQGNPYNLHCPMDSDMHSLAGCTAVATAIVMNYYKWPQKGIGSTKGYYTSYGSYVPARNLDHIYDWDNMLDEYYDGYYSQDQAEAVSVLMADIGCAFQADYTQNSTAASVDEKSMCENFSYNEGMCYVPKERYTDQEWHEMLFEELKASRPVLYRGDDGYIGHCFVLDGFTDNDYFHINWGWGGYCDGYYYLSSLTPGDDNYYSDDQGAWFNFYPDYSQSDEANEWLKVRAPGLSSDTDNFNSKVPFKINIDYIINTANVDFNGYIRLALVSYDNQIKEWISNEISMQLQPNYYISRRSINCEISGNIQTGDRIRVFYCSINSSQWCPLVSHGDDSIWELLVTDPFSLEESTSVEYKQKENTITIRFIQGANITVYRGENPISDGLRYNYDNLEIDTNELEEGLYTIVLSKGNQRKEFTISIKSL